MLNKKATRALTLGIRKNIYPRSKRSQEEMVGFAVIMIIVAVIVLIFLSLTLRNQNIENVEDYEVTSFIQSVLTYTTDCAEGYVPRYRSIEKLIIDCSRREKCLDERKTCDVLDSTLSGILKESWKVDGDTPIKGYDLKIDSDESLIIQISQGNITNNYKNSIQELGKQDIKIVFTAYY